MAVTKAKKSEIVKELTDKFKRAKSLVFVKNNGVDVKSLTQLKREMHKSNVEVKVAKKTLMQLAFKENNIPEVPEEILTGPIMTVLSYEDEIAGAKILKAFMKTNEKIEFMGGVIDHKLFHKKDIIALAGLPGKQELLAKVVGSLKSPLYGLHHALSYHLRGLVQVLSQIEKQKGGTPA